MDLEFIVISECSVPLQSPLDAKGSSCRDHCQLMPEDAGRDARLVDEDGPVRLD